MAPKAARSKKQRNTRSIKTTAKSSSTARRAKTESGDKEDRSLREHLIYLLRGGGAHLDFDKVVADLPAKRRGEKVHGLPHSSWQLLEHMRIAQWDILEFSRNPKHVSPDWPTGYWPETEAPPDVQAWKKSIQAFHNDLNVMVKLVSNLQSDLFSPFPHGDGQTLLREALLIADHNAYHLGQIVMLRRLLGVWTE